MQSILIDLCSVSPSGVVTSQLLFSKEFRSHFARVVLVASNGYVCETHCSFKYDWHVHDVVDEAVLIHWILFYFFIHYLEYLKIWNRNDKQHTPFYSEFQALQDDISFASYFNFQISAFRHFANNFTNYARNTL